MIRLVFLLLVIFLVCLGNPAEADCSGCNDNGCTCIGSSIGQSCDQSHCTGTISPRCDAGGCNQDGTTKPYCCLGFCSQVKAIEPKCVEGHCNQDGATKGPVCTGGECSQVATESPVCTGGGCDQSSSVSPKCLGGSCTQTKASGTANCVGGSCNTAGAEAVNCLGGSCCVDGTEGSVSCLGGSCNDNARSCSETGCGGSPCDTSIPANGINGTCTGGNGVVYPDRAVKLVMVLATLALMAVLYKNCKSSPQRHDDETRLQQQEPLLDEQENGSEDPTATGTAEHSAEINEEPLFATKIATAIDVEDQEVTGSSVLDTKSAAQDS